RAHALMELRQFDEALRSLDEALAAVPTDTGLLCARADVLDQLGRYDDALAAYEQAIAIDSDHIATRNNIARTLSKLDRPQQALAHLEHALTLAPNIPDLHFNAALCRLYLGDFAQGWRQYEARWGKNDLKAAQRHFAQPLWLGESDLMGRTVLLHAE